MKPLSRVYDFIHDEEDTRVCKDIPDAACKHLPRNFFAYLGANTLTKLADELSSARLILPWLMSALGAPASFVGYIVPLREAGVLVPQMAVAAYIRRLPRRKYAWLLGALLSGLALLALCLSGLALQGAAAGATILVLIGVYSLARGICSVSAKDVVGKTVSKKRRGSLMGMAAGISGGLSLALGVYLAAFQPERQGAGVPLILIGAAAVIWLASLALFQAIKEEPGSTEGGGDALRVASENIALLREDRDFRRYLISRILLLSVALAPPFYVLLAQEGSQSAGQLGWLILANGLASMLSSPLWGRLGDRSSRLVMALAATGAGLLGLGIFALHYLNGELASKEWIHAIAFFLIAICHGGVRLGRKVYLVDMTSGDRSGYVAVGNTVTGLAMLALGSVGFLAQALGPAPLLALLGLASLAAALFSLQLRDVSG